MVDPAAPAPAPAPGADSSPPPLAPGLYLVGTPIGNLEDITLRALRILRAATHILAEDTRHTRILLDRHGISTPLISCHKFNERARQDEILSRIRAGEALALVTDAGMPGISDPGARAAGAVRAAGLSVTVIPGPCALSAAVALCGETESRGFLFEGFLDHKTAARRRRLRATRRLPRARRLLRIHPPHLETPRRSRRRARSRLGNSSSPANSPRSSRKPSPAPPPPSAPITRPIPSKANSS
jgi:16S rRNA (cytidine1402-2'-O)-methyltransferase